MFRNRLNLIIRFLLRGYCISVDMTEKDTGKTKRIVRYISKEAFQLMRMQMQQEMHQMHQQALDQQVEAAREA